VFWSLVARRGPQQTGGGWHRGIDLYNSQPHARRAALALESMQDWLAGRIDVLRGAA